MQKIKENCKVMGIKAENIINMNEIEKKGSWYAIEGGESERARGREITR